MNRGRQRHRIWQTHRIWHRILRIFRFLSSWMFTFFWVLRKKLVKKQLKTKSFSFFIIQKRKLEIRGWRHLFNYAPLFQSHFPPTTVIHVAIDYRINYNCFNEPFAVSPYKGLYLHPPTDRYSIRLDLRSTLVGLLLLLVAHLGF